MLRKTFALSLVVVLACSLFFSVSTKSVSASSGTTQIYWGAWVGNHHIGYYDLLTTFENQVGKGVSIWNWIQLWTRPDDSENVAEFDTALMNQCRQHGAIPMVSWAPDANDGNPNYINLQSILNGNWDTYLTAWGQASAAWGHPYFVRLFWEFTGSWVSSGGAYPWSNGNTPQIFVQTWQYIVSKVRAAGGTQISWVWCTGDVGDSVSTLQSVYPGDAYVDWVGTDIYIGQGQTFDQGVHPELDNIRAVASNKPVMIPETGYSGSDSASYWYNLLTNELPNNYPYIKAVVIWEMPSGLTVVDSATLPSFKQGIASSYYSSNVYSSLNISPIIALSGSVPTPTSTFSIPTPTPSTSGAWIAPVTIPIIVIVGVLVVIIVSILIYRRHRKNSNLSQ